MTPFWKSPVKVVRLVLAVLIPGIALTLLLTPKPWDSAPPERISDFVRIYSWWAALLNLAPLTALLLTTTWWLSPILPPHPKSKIQNPKFFLPLVLGAMLVSAVLGAIRLPQSLWDDEVYSVQRCVMGAYRERDDGSLKFRDVSWVNTFWFYTKPTNHVLQSVLSRVSLNTWRTFMRPRGLQLNEPALRLPSYVAGILSVGAIALLLAAAGFPQAGALAAWLLALHPWHLRLTPEARGYGFVMLLIPLACHCALRALQTGAWKWWIGLALAEFALLATWPPSAMVILVLNLCLATQILRSPREARGALAGRWLATGAVAGMAAFQLLLPSIPQFLAYEKRIMFFAAHTYWLKNVGCSFLTGTLWSKSGKNPTPYLELMPDSMAHPGLSIVFAVLAVGFFTLGVITMLRRGAPSAWLVWVFLVPGLLLFIAAVVKNKFLFEWYMAFMLPGLVALVAAGVLAAATPFARWKPLRALPVVLSVLVLAGYAVLTTKPRTYLLTRSVQYYRDSVLISRPNLDPYAPENREIITATTMVTPDVYDPFIRKAKTLADYSALIKEAEERGVPLYVNNGFPIALKESNPDVFALLSDESAFERVQYFYAIEEMLDRAVHKYRPGSLKDVDLAQYRQTVRVAAPE